MNPIKRVIIPLALGSIYSNAGEGELIAPLDGAVTRFVAGTRSFFPGDNVLVVCTAGYKSGRFQAPHDGIKVSLADQLKRFVTENDITWLSSLNTAPLVWGTYRELRMGIRRAFQTGFVKPGEAVELIIASNWAHINPRIKFYMRMILPKGWTVKYEIAKHPFSLMSHGLEIAKIMRDIPYFWKIKRRQSLIKNYRHIRQLRLEGKIPPG